MFIPKKNKKLSLGPLTKIFKLSGKKKESLKPEKSGSTDEPKGVPKPIEAKKQSKSLFARFKKKEKIPQLPKAEPSEPPDPAKKKGSLVESLVSLGKKLKTRIESNPKLAVLLQKIKNHPRVVWAVQKFQNLDWSERVAVMIGVAGLLLFIMGPYALLYRKTHLITYEASRRGETLIHLLAAQNQPAFSDEESLLYNVDFVSQEPGVNDAVVTDLKGTILFPIERFGKKLEKIKTNGKPHECTRHQKGLDIEFFCPIFKWVEKDEGFVKEPMGMAYLNYSAHESLDLMGSRAFHVLYLLVIFAAILGVVIYLIVTITHKPLEDLRYNLVAYHRGGTETIAPPDHFKALQNLTKELTVALKSKGGGDDARVESLAAAGGNDASLVEIIRQVALNSQKETLLIDSDKKLIFASDRLREESKIETDQHILRAVKSSPYVNELIEFFSRLLEEPSKGLTLSLPGMDPMQGILLKLWGKDYYLVMSL